MCVQGYGSNYHQKFQAPMKLLPPLRWKPRQPRSFSMERIQWRSWRDRPSSLPKDGGFMTGQPTPPNVPPQKLRV